MELNALQIMIFTGLAGIAGLLLLEVVRDTIREIKRLWAPKPKPQKRYKPRR